MINPFNILKKYILVIKNYNRLKIVGYIRLGKNDSIKCLDTSKLFINRNCTFRNYVTLRTLKSGNMTIGKNCFFNQNVSVTSMRKIEIGDNCKIANNVVIVDHDHDYKNDLKNFICEPVKIGNNVWIGANSVILKGVTIGDNSVVAAGTIVKDNIDTNKMLVSRLKQDLYEVGTRNE
ncbi:hypothetical protein IGI37_000780 [Enterococcus sp. AZ194]|uniref:acyltransferase n=1 Tax=Enterococcus sp. AZ194 TaxID=2774629 RepID=UPI003F25EF53